MDDYYDVKYGIKIETIDDEYKMDIVMNLFNKFGSSWELSNYLKSKGVTIEE